MSFANRTSNLTALATSLRSTRVRNGGVKPRRVHAPGDLVDDIGRVLANPVLVRLVVEGHAHQRLPERIAVGRIEIQIVVAARHHTSRRRDVHRALVPFGGCRFPGLAALRRTARHRPIPDGQDRVEPGGYIVSAHKPVRRAIEFPVRSVTVT